MRTATTDTKYLARELEAISIYANEDWCKRRIDEILDELIWAGVMTEKGVVFIGKGESVE